MPRTAVAGLFVVALSVSSAGNTLGQGATRIVDSSACRECSIRLVPVVTLLGTAEVALSQQTRVVLSGEHYVAGPTYVPGTLQVFDSRGTPILTFGRPGAGPGEIQGRSFRLASGPGDSIHVVDLYRWSVFAPRDYRFVRSVNVAGLATAVEISPAGEWIAAIQHTSPSGETRLVHLIDPADGSPHRSLVPAAGTTPTVENVRLLHADRRGIWITPIGSVDIHLAGTTVRYFRDSGWFPGTSSFHPDEPYYRPPSPRVTGLRTMGEVLLVYALVADRNWRPLPLPTLPERPRVTTIHSSEIFDGVIEAVDMRTGQVLVRTRVDWDPRPITGSTDLVQRSRELPNGEIAIDVLRVVLLIPPSR